MSKTQVILKQHTQIRCELKYMTLNTGTHLQHRHHKPDGLRIWLRSFLLQSLDLSQQLESINTMPNFDLASIYNDWSKVQAPSTTTKF